MTKKPKDDDNDVDTDLDDNVINIDAAKRNEDQGDEAEDAIETLEKQVADLKVSLDQEKERVRQIMELLKE